MSLDLKRPQRGDKRLLRVENLNMNRGVTIFKPMNVLSKLIIC